MEAARDVHDGGPMHTSSARFAAQLSVLSLLLFLFIATGCASMYTQGAMLATPDAPTRVARRRGCLDVAVSLVGDPRLPKGSALVSYEFGNTCDEATSIDLSRAKVTARAGDHETKLALFDPGVRLHPALLDGRLQGSQAIRYDGAEPEPPYDHVCVDLREVIEGRAGEVDVICLDASAKLPAAVLYEPGIHGALGACGPEGHQPYPMHADCWGGDLEWEAPAGMRLRGDYGLGLHTIDPSQLSFWHSGTDKRGGARLGDQLRTGTLDLRLTGYATRALYWGFESQVGAGEAPRASLEPAPSTIMTVGPSVHLAAGALVGLSTPRSGILQGRAELFAGGRLLVIAARDEATGTKADGYLSGAWNVEPRAVVDLWMRPDLSLALWAGAEVVHPGDWSSGIALVFHMRSFDAR